MEYEKRIDPQLPYYYYTSAHDRFYEGDRPSFNEPKQQTREVRLPRRELSCFTSGRATLPVRGTLHTRATFHNLPVDLPPPPGVPSHMAEHSYNRS